MFRQNILPPSSGSKNEPNNLQEARRHLLAYEVTPQNITSSCCSPHICYSDLVFPVHHNRNNPTVISRKYCDMWTVSRKRIGKHVATERLIPENQLISKHGFQTVAGELKYCFRDNAFVKHSNGTLGGGDLCEVLS
jgi:hypothetical protein